jgi:RyR domain
MKSIHIAQAAHEINKAYCDALGDNSQPVWEEAPEWQKESAIKGVEFHLANPEASPSASHESWMAQKTEEGWKFGPIKDAEKKEHPCYVSYEELPVEQRAKDYLFKQIVHSLKQHLD